MHLYANHGPLGRIYDRMKLLPGLAVLADGLSGDPVRAHAQCAATGDLLLGCGWTPTSRPPPLSSRISEDASRRPSHRVRTQVVTQPSRSEPDEKTKTERGDEDPPCRSCQRAHTARTPVSPFTACFSNYLLCHFSTFLHVVVV